MLTFIDALWHDRLKAPYAFDDGHCFRAYAERQLLRMIPVAGQTQCINNRLLPFPPARVKMDNPNANSFSNDDSGQHSSR